MRPILPSWMRSRNCRPRLVYFFAMEITRRKLASIISFFARLASVSPFCTAETILRNSGMLRLEIMAISAMFALISITSSLRVLANSFQPFSFNRLTRRNQDTSNSFPIYCLRKLSRFILCREAKRNSFPSRVMSLRLRPYSWSTNSSILKLLSSIGFCSPGGLIIRSLTSCINLARRFSVAVVISSLFCAASSFLICIRDIFEDVFAISPKISRIFGRSASSIADRGTFPSASSESPSSSVSFSSESDRLASSFDFTEVGEAGPFVGPPKVPSRSITSLSNISSSVIDACQLLMAASVIGLSQMDPNIMFRPASIRFAIAISPSRERSSTLPISRKYILTGSSALPSSSSALGLSGWASFWSGVSCELSSVSSSSTSWIPSSENIVWISSIRSEEFCSVGRALLRSLMVT